MRGGYNYDMLKRDEQNEALVKRDSTFNRNGQYARLRRYRKFYKVRRMSARQIQLLMEAVYKRQEDATRASRFTILLTLAMIAVIIVAIYWWVMIDQ